MHREWRSGSLRRVSAATMPHLLTREAPMDESAGIPRREAVRRLGVLVGGALSSSTVSALLAGCGPEPRDPPASWTPRALSSAQLDRLAAVVDRILPPTDTPGASEVGVPEFIDRLLADWAREDERTRVLDGLDSLDDLSVEALGTPFLEADRAQQTELLSRLDVEAVAARGRDDDPLPFFATLKEWTLVGYYTSEAGATRELQWLAAPGRFDGDLPLDEVGRTWA